MIFFVILLVWCQNIKQNECVYLQVQTYTLEHNSGTQTEFYKTGFIEREP